MAFVIEIFEHVESWEGSKFMQIDIFLKKLFFETELKVWIIWYFPIWSKANNRIESFRSSIIEELFIHAKHKKRKTLNTRKRLHFHFMTSCFEQLLRSSSQKLIWITILFFLILRFKK